MAGNEWEPTSAPNSADLTPGTTLSNTYEIVEYLALGGMAEVYRARNIHTDEPVAIKVVLPEYARDETRLALFRKEATVLSRLHHEAIVHYHMFTVEKETNRPYLVMEFVKGTPLSDRMKEGPLDAGATKSLIQRVATGLSAAHELGVVHRDLSPDNVVLPDGNVGKAKIIDFGIAKDAGGGTLLGGKFAGKYNFVSPEQLGLYGGDITGQSDIYSLGLIAVAALRGEALDMGGSHAEVIDKRRSVPDLGDIDPAIRPAIEAMLAPDPAQRPRTMQDVVDLLSAPSLTAKPMPGPAADDPWGEPPPSKHPAEPAWTNPADSEGTVIAPRPPVQPQRPPARGPATVVTGAPTGAANESESPFGAFVPPAGSPPPFQVPNAPSRPPAPEIAARTQGRGGAGGLIALLAVLILVGGGAGFAYTQNWFGLLDPALAPDQPAEDVATAQPPEADAPPIDEPVAQPAGTSTLVPDDQPAAPPLRADQQAGPFEPAQTAGSDVQVSETATPSTPAVDEPVVETVAPVTPQPQGEEPVDPGTKIAEVEQPNEIPPLEGVPAMIEWVKSYPLGACQFAQALAADERSMSIEAYGTSVPPFEEMMFAFETEIGFEPDIFLRVATEPQCAVVDFLRFVKPLAEAGPRLQVDSTQVSRGGALSGNLQGISGWQTDVLLVDDAGIVHAVTTSAGSSGATATFSAPIASSAPEGAPVLVVSVSSKTGLDAPGNADGMPASAVFPAILREIQRSGASVAIGVIYARLGG